jgi:hypothetical protein
VTILSCELLVNSFPFRARRAYQSQKSEPKIVGTS